MGDLNAALSDFQQSLQGVAENPLSEVVAGQLVDRSNGWYVNVRGKEIPAIWLDSVNPYNAAPCLCVLTSVGGRDRAWVLGTTRSTALPDYSCTVTVVPAGGTTATVTSRGQTFTANRLSSYTPTVGDVAYIEWRGGNPYLVGAITLAPPPPTPPPPPPPPPPAAPQTGTFNTGIVDSGTWSAGYNWNGYFGPHTYSGSGYVPPSSGNWFYGGATRALADKPNIGQVRFFLGSRRQAGAWSSTVTVHFYVHNADWRGGGEPSRISGPFDVSVPPFWGGGWIVLPSSVGTSLKSGGGLSIAGDPYVGFTAGPEQPSAGALSIDWSM